MMDEKNPHFENTAWSQKIYWKGNAACGRDDSPDRVDLCAATGGWEKITFEMPRQKHDLGRMERLMERAYEKGLADRSVAVGKLLKELISL